MNVEGTDMYLSSEGQSAAGRETTELLQYKGILFRAMQHRVANSLQIIAGILVFEARSMQSEESRLPLQDAYCRIISVATLQRHLRPRDTANQSNSSPICVACAIHWRRR
jgi:two-component sensor histidine kinase